MIFYKRISQPSARLPRVDIERRQVKYARLSVYHDGRVRMVVPHRFSESKVQQLLQKHASWIQKHRERFANLERIELEENQILYRGKPYRFVLKPSLGSAVLLYCERHAISSGADLLRQHTLDEWYIAEAQRVIPRRVKSLAQRFGFEYHNVRVAHSKTQWGSCSSRKDLMFNWRLIKVPPRVLDYLILHELVHTEVMNHSKRFWKRVEEVCPDYTESVVWLKTYGRWV